MIRMNLQLFGGRSSAGGNAKASATRAAEPKATQSKANKQNQKEKSSSASAKSWRELDKEPIGSAYMSPAGTIYVKNNSEGAVNANWTPHFPSGGYGYAKDSQDIAELLKKGGFTKLSSNSTYRAAGSYNPTPQALEKAKELRKAYNAEQKRREAEKKAKATTKKKGR